MVTAYLALGSNLGDREATLRGAREALDAIEGIRVVAFSPLYQTEPVGGPPDQAPYLNAVLEIETTLSPLELLHCCLETENSFGRKREQKWGPRTLDVDLLFYGEEVCSTDELILPHPRLHERLFVLVPLRDIAPDLLHPVFKRTIREFFADVAEDEGICLFSETW